MSSADRPRYFHVRLFRSLRFRLPFLIVALLCVTIGTFAWYAHRKLTRTFEHSAGARLDQASGGLATMLGIAIGRMRTDLQKVASDPTISAALIRPNSATAKAARAALLWASAPANQFVSRSLWSRDCALLLSVGPGAPSSSPNACPAHRQGHGTTTADGAGDASVSAFADDGDSVRYDIVAVVRGARGDTLGYVADARTLAWGRDGQLISGLIDKDVTVMVGNGSGAALWTDLAKRVNGPPLTAARGAPARYTTASGTLEMGATRRVPGTPWLVWVQIPVIDVFAPERNVMRELGLMALVCVLIGALGAWAVGRHVTSPLLELTLAAEDLAVGDYSRRVSARRRGELGFLMASFNWMATQVEAYSTDLRALANELQERADAAQNLAHELELSNQELIEALEEASAARRDTTVAQSLLDDVLVQAPVGIAVFDREMRYVRANQAVADIHGVPLDAHIGRRPREVMAGLGDLAEPLIRRVLDTGERVLHHNLTIVSNGNAKRHWTASCFPIHDASGDISGVGAILVDTTAQHELEAQFLQSQKMEAVGRLAGGIAHDFNNLLTIIMSYSSLALSGLRAEDPMHEDIGEIQAAAARATRLTSQLLAFSRKQVMRPEPLNLTRVATDMEHMLQRLVGEDVILELALEPDLGTVSADPGQIEQIIMNLVVNARDAMPRGGRLTLATANTTLSAEHSASGIGRTAGEYVSLTVSDTGTGMSDETQAKIFEPFFTTKKPGQGTGLGLPTVYGIVKQSGGDIRVTSELGRGSTFRICIPRVQDEKQAAAVPESLSGVVRGGFETILLVEDDEPLRDLAARILRRAGYVVLDTRSASEAVQTGRAHEGPIDLLLTDVVMPEMSGRAVREQLEQHRSGFAVLYMSGYNSDDVVRRGVSATETELLQKPFTPEQLILHVRRVLDGKAAHREM